MPLDTRLARLLHDRQRIDLPTLQTLLEEARTNRDPRGEGLARSLVQRGLLSEDELESYVAELRSVDPSLSDSGLRASWAGESAEASSSQVDRIGWRPGGRVDDYRLLDRLGQGGMGVVFLGEHMATGARYAVKAIPLDADEDMLERFRREGQAQAAVDAHPNVVRVHTAGTAAGHQYLVMDVVTGGDLEERLRGGSLSPQEAAGLVAQLARGLAHVHSKGVLHRDLKPSNVLFDEEGTPKLADFGLVRLSGENRMTRTGDVLGSPAYMAPEQAEGLGELDERTDVYGLGAILYEALTGQPPFNGRTALEVMTKVLLERPVAPRKLAPGVPAALEELCLRALARDRSDRFASASEMAASLESFLASGREGPRRAKREASRAPLAVGAMLLLGAVGGGLLLAFGGDGADGARPERGKRSRAMAPRAQPKEPAPAPSPPEAEEKPAVPRPDWLAWRQRRGERGRLVLRIDYDEETIGTGALSDLVGAGSKLQGTLVFDWELLGEDEARITLSVSVAEARAEARSAIYRFSFDANDPVQRERAYSRIVGCRFTLVVDRSSGAVGPVRLPGSLVRALNVEQQKGTRQRTLNHLVGLFAERGKLRLLFNRYFHLFREDLQDVSQPWEVVDDQEVFVRASPANPSQVDAALVRKISFEPLEPEGAKLTWSGTLRFIKTQGEAVWSRGRIQRMTSIDTFEGKHRDSGAHKKAKLTYTFTDEAGD